MSLETYQVGCVPRLCHWVLQTGSRLPARTVRFVSLHSFSPRSVADLLNLLLCLDPVRNSMPNPNRQRRRLEFPMCREPDSSLKRHSDCIGKTGSSLRVTRRVGRARAPRIGAREARTQEGANIRVKGRGSTNRREQGEAVEGEARGTSARSRATNVDRWVISRISASSPSPLVRLLAPPH